MANITLQLEEQLSDLRSNEIAYRFAAENRDPKSVHLRSLTPQVAEGVTLLEVRDTSERAVRLKYRTLCDELTAVLQSYLSRMEQDKQKAQRFLVRVFGSTEGERTIDFTIEGSEDARTALATWFGGPSQADDVPEKKLFEAKLTQLTRYEQQLKEEATSSEAITTLASGSVFSTIYVFRFARGLWDPRKYTVTVEASYAEDDKPSVVETAATSASTTISPPPLVLSSIAVVSSILGAILKTALGAAGEQPEEGLGIGTMLYNVGLQLVEAVVKFSTLGGMVVALLIFNVYEHTELGTKVKMGVGWRTALLIGVLAGLFTERLLKAITVFVGITQGP